MGEIAKYKEEVMFLEPFKGTINTKRGQKTVESVKGQINGQDFIVTASGKGIWIKIRRKGMELHFNMPISQMYNVKKVKETVKGQVKTYIVYEMTKGMHWSATFGKKDANGKRMFKPRPSCGRCGNYREREGRLGYNQSGSSNRSI